MNPIDLAQTATTEPMTTEGAIGFLAGALLMTGLLYMIAKATGDAFGRVVLSGLLLLAVLYFIGQATP